jgi:DNA-binding transcriptional LysR family regulator
MQRLEEQVGHPLFEKHGRGKRLTEHGQRLLTYARQLMAIHDEALRVLQQGDLQGHLRIGAPHDVADTVLPSLLAEVVRNWPTVQVSIQVGRSPFLADALRRGELDMAISNRAENEFEGLMLRSSPTVWLCAANYVHDRGQPIPLVMVDGPSIFRKLGQEALEAAGIPFAHRYTSSSLIGIRAALRAGLGVTARGVEQLDATLRVLGPNEGMPTLPDLVYSLFVRRYVANNLPREVFEHLRSRLRPGAAFT